MEYQEKLKQATTCLTIQLVYNAEFDKEMKELEEEMSEEYPDYKIVDTSGSVDINVAWIDISLLILAEDRARKLFGKKQKGVWIKSKSDDFIDTYQKEK